MYIVLYQCKEAQFDWTTVDYFGPFKEYDNAILWTQDPENDLSDSPNDRYFVVYVNPV